MQHYRKMCHPDQGRLFCYPNKNRNKANPYRISMNQPIGANTIAKYGKNVAELCNFVDYKKFAMHGYHCMHVSNNVNNDVPEYEHRKHSRHALASQRPYVLSNKSVVQQYQSTN